MVQKTANDVGIVSPLPLTLPTSATLGDTPGKQKMSSEMEVEKLSEVTRDRWPYPN